MNKPIERMKKILELARRGEGGEKETTESMLKKLLAKYDMTIDDLEDQAPKRYYTIAFRGEPQRRLLVQIVGFVLSSPDVAFWRHRVKSELTFELTAPQFAEVDMRFEAYKPALRAAIDKATDRVISAFVQTNGIALVVDDPDQATREPMDLAELEALMSMMRTMKPTPVYRQIEEGEGL